jgi:hypothetical protein
VVPNNAAVRPSTFGHAHREETTGKFGFFKRLSPLMIAVKAVLILAQECRSEIRIAAVLLGAVFDVFGKFQVSEFTDDVFNDVFPDNCF